MPTKIKYPCAHPLPPPWSTCVLCSPPSLQGLGPAPPHFHIHCSLGRISNINIGTSTTQLLFNYSAPTRAALLSAYIHYSDGVTQFKFQHCEHSENLLNNTNNVKAVYGTDRKVLPKVGESQGSNCPQTEMKKQKVHTNIYTYTCAYILLKRRHRAHRFN